jgi:hypothetical protein
VLSLSTILGSVKAGQLFALAVTTPERSKLLPDVPTIANPPYRDSPPRSGMALWPPPVRQRPSSSGSRANCVLR